ncbi:MAG TPA: hypothetical protein VFZ59_07430 [Verrucomicrobiae bacterium]|nr:hypothetical protein [Verrucomicrobiae bacterium]
MRRIYVLPGFETRRLQVLEAVIHSESFVHVAHWTVDSQLKQRSAIIVNHTRT